MLARRAGEIRSSEPLQTLPDGLPVVLATGGFQGDAELGSASHHAGGGAARPAGEPLEHRRRPAPRPRARGRALAWEWTSSTAATSRLRREISPGDFVSLAQVYARVAKVENMHGERYEPRTWSEIDVVQWTARQPGARARYLVPDEALGEPVRERTVGEVIEAARRAGAPVERRDGSIAVEVVAGITTTLGGIKVDARARAADGLYAAGADAGGISTGGWASALAVRARVRQARRRGRAQLTARWR